MKFLYEQGLISVYRDVRKGFCVCVNDNVSKGTLLCINVVGTIGPLDLNVKSKFNSYPMWWNKKTDVIAFGPINLLNHSGKPNVLLTRDRKNMLIKMYAGRNLKSGEELVVDYDCDLWFEVVEK
jgi:hypothetical protein